MELNSKYRFWLFSISIVLLFSDSMFSQAINLPAESLQLVSQKVDSVFIFADGLAVTAWGENLNGIKYENQAIDGDGIPPSLKLRQPKGAIIYQTEFSYPEIPVILGRTNKRLALDKIYREYLLGFTHFKGKSSKGGVSIRVWEPENRLEMVKIFMNDGRVFRFGESSRAKFRTKNEDAIDFEKLVQIEDEIAGAWIYPPELGVNYVTDKILSLLEKGPVLIEYWDGLSWEFLEKAYLSNAFSDENISVDMCHALFPPETEINFPALVNGGIPTPDVTNLFQALEREDIGFSVFEGEKLTLNIPGNVKLHSGSSAQQKDEAIFRSTKAAIENDSAPLVFIHYHGLDDLNHSLGPNDRETLAHFQNLWQWHLSLRKSWAGAMLIVSDHGAHAISEGNSEENKFANKGTKGTHGDFIFADMAVPVIEDRGQGAPQNNFRLSEKQKADLWDFIGRINSTRIASSIENEMKLEIIFKGASFFITKENSRDLFDQTFEFHYLKKGKPVDGIFQGVKLIDLAGRFGIPTSVGVKAFSFDNFQLVYTNADLLDNLFISANFTADRPEDVFTLYPLKDQFPNRVLKQLKKIEFLKIHH